MFLKNGNSIGFSETDLATLSSDITEPSISAVQIGLCKTVASSDRAYYCNQSIMTELRKSKNCDFEFIDVALQSLKVTWFDSSLEYLFLPLVIERSSLTLICIVNWEYAIAFCNRDFSTEPPLVISNLSRYKYNCY